MGLCARLTKYIFSDMIDLENKLVEFINYYNEEAKLKTLGYLSPKEYLLKKNNIIQPIVI